MMKVEEKYKELKKEHKILCLISLDEFQEIEEEFNKVRAQVLENDDNININLNQKLFIKVLHKISKVIKYNYLDDFYKEKCNELLSIPTNLYKNYIPNLEFNSLNTRIQRKEHNKNINIFETLNSNYNYSQSVASDPRLKGNNTISSNN